MKTEIKKVILFASGNGSNVQNIIEYFTNSNEVEIVLVAGNNRNAYVFQRAKSLNINTLAFDKNFFNKKFINIIEKYNADLIVLAGFLWKVPRFLINKFPNRIINIHPSLLPKYGGKGMYGQYVHELVLKNKEKKTGISIHIVNDSYDKGKIIFQAEIEVNNNDSLETIIEKVHVLEKENYPRVIKEYLSKI